METLAVESIASVSYLKRDESKESSRLRLWPADQDQRQQRNRTRAREVIADIRQAMVRGKPRGHIRRQRGADDTGKVESQRGASVPDRGGKEFRQGRSQGTVSEPHEAQPQ